MCFTINFVMGAGFLGVPKAFVESGYILGPAVMVCCALVCDITKNMELEACARAEAITEVRCCIVFGHVLHAATLTVVALAVSLDRCWCSVNRCGAQRREQRRWTARQWLDCVPCGCYSSRRVGSH